MNRSSRIGFALALLLLGGSLFAHSFAPSYATMGIGSPVSPVFYPRILLGLWMFLSLIVLVEAIRVPGNIGQAPQSWSAPLAMVLVMAVSVWAMRWLGYIGIAAPLAFTCGWLLGYRRIVILILVALLAGAISWWLFDRMLGIPLPRWRLT